MQNEYFLDLNSTESQEQMILIGKTRFCVRFEPAEINLNKFLTKVGLTKFINTKICRKLTNYPKLHLITLNKLFRIIPKLLQIQSY